MCTKEETIVLDPPGQPELTTHHMALPRILQRLEKLGYRVIAAIFFKRSTQQLTHYQITVVQCLDSVVVTRPSLYLSSLLLCVRGMLHLPYPIGACFELSFAIVSTVANRSQ